MATIYLDALELRASLLPEHVVELADLPGVPGGEAHHFVVLDAGIALGKLVGQLQITRPFTIFLQHNPPQFHNFPEHKQLHSYQTIDNCHQIKKFLNFSRNFFFFFKLIFF